jgi:hypothetical protein
LRTGGVGTLNSTDFVSGLPSEDFISVGKSPPALKIFDNGAAGAMVGRGPLAGRALVGGGTITGCYSTTGCSGYFYGYFGGSFGAGFFTTKTSGLLGF